MKKIVSILAVVLSLFMFTLVGCSAPQKQEYTRVKLTADNYTEYISVNLYYIDYQIVSSQENEFGLVTYTVNQTIAVETSRKTAVRFENASMMYSPESDSSRGKISTSLNMNGSSISSFTRFFEHSFAELPHLSNFLLGDIEFEGYVLIPTEE